MRWYFELYEWRKYKSLETTLTVKCITCTVIYLQQIAIKFQTLNIGRTNSHQLKESISVDIMGEVIFFSRNDNRMYEVFENAMHGYSILEICRAHL